MLLFLPVAETASDRIQVIDELNKLATTPMQNCHDAVTRRLKSRATGTTPA